MRSTVNSGVGAQVHAIIQGFRLTETLPPSTQSFQVALSLESGTWEKEPESGIPGGLEMTHLTSASPLGKNSDI